MDKAIAPIIEQQQADTKQLEASIAFRWAEYQQADRQRTAKGLDFGKACYELRERTKAQGSRTGEGFTAALEKLGVSKPTAYRWIDRYAASAGLRITRDEVTESIIQQLSSSTVTIGVCDDITVRIEPSDNEGFYFVTCFDTVNAVADGLSKPIRQDAVSYAITATISESKGDDGEKYPAECFTWGIAPAEATKSNRWLGGAA